MDKYPLDTELYSLVDRNKLWKNIRALENTDPYKGILEEVWKVHHYYPHQRTIEWTREYFKNLTVNICWARHERLDNNIDVRGCPLRPWNIACLHGLEFYRHAADGYILFGFNMWGTRVFGVSYVLNELGYDAPLFVQDFDNLQMQIRKYDQWEMNENHLTWNLYDSTNPETEDFQRRIVQEFRIKYINPIREQFLKFYQERVMQ